MCWQILAVVRLAGDAWYHGVLARNSSGATTPSEVFSATVSTAARVTAASSSRSVSRPTIMETAWREAARSPLSSAS